MHPQHIHTVGGACSQWESIGGESKRSGPLPQSGTTLWYHSNSRALPGIRLRLHLNPQFYWFPLLYPISLPPTCFIWKWCLNKSLAKGKKKKKKKTYHCKGDQINLVRLWNNLCPWILLKTTEQPASNYLESSIWVLIPRHADSLTEIRKATENSAKTNVIPEWLCMCQNVPSEEWKPRLHTVREILLTRIAQPSH